MNYSYPESAEVVLKAIQLSSYNDQQLELSPEGKMLWLKLLFSCAKFEYKLTQTTKVICSYHGVNRNLFTRTIQALSRCGLVKKKSAVTKLGGNSYSYHFCKLESEMAQPHSPSQVKSLVLELIIGKEPIKNLTSANRLILIILLQHADDFGVVSDIGRAQIGALAGMTKERVRSHIEKLKQLGLIDWYSSGSTNTSLIGRQSTTYFLNLWYKKFSHRVSAIHFIDPLIFEPPEAVERKLLRSINKKVLPTNSKDSNKPILSFSVNSFMENISFNNNLNILKHFFKGDNNKLRTSISLKINALASTVLNQYWEELDMSHSYCSETQSKWDIERSILENLKIQIQESLLPKGVSNSPLGYHLDLLHEQELDGEDLNALTRDKVFLINLFSNLVWLRALRAKIFINKLISEDMSLSDLSFFIRPISPMHELVNFYVIAIPKVDNNEQLNEKTIFIDAKKNRHCLQEARPSLRVYICTD